MTYWVLLFGVLFVAWCIAWYFDTKAGYNDMLSRGAVGVVGGLVLVVSLLVATTNKAGVHGDLAAAEQLRRATASVDLSASEDVAGQASDFNRALAQCKWQNSQWWGDPFVPDEWLSVDYIPMRSQP